MKKNEGNKFDKNKVRYELIPVFSLRELAKILTSGAIKYGDRNWEKGFAWSRAYGAAQRHLNAFWGGEDIDKESGQPHLAHALCEVMFLLEFTKTHKDKDDRNKL